jgi:hypothetical protein
MPHDGFARFPAWITASGLPAHLAAEAKSPLAWLLWRTIVEREIGSNRRPGPVECTLADLEQATGIPAAKIPPLVGKLRKAGVLRAFLPEGEEDAALFQIVAPLPTPTPWETVRASNPALAELPDSAFRYATESAPAPDEDAPGGEAPESKLKAVVDLYLDTVSMKMNSFVLDELRLIAARFDLALIRKVFARARSKEVQSLSWIVREARQESAAAARIKAARAAGKGVR